MSRKTQKTNLSRCPLRFEQLEDRTPLAVATFDINLYEDRGGVPGLPIVGETVEAGQSFFVEITAREWDPLRAGLAGVSLDIAWNPGVIAESDAGFDINQIITPNLPALRRGSLDSEAGTIKDLSGSAMTSSSYGRTIGNLWAERFALLHFTALRAGETTLTMSPGFTKIVTYPEASLTGDKVWFEPQTITVVPGSGETESNVTAESPTLPEIPQLPAETPSTPSTSSAPVEHPAKSPVEVGPKDEVNDPNQSAPDVDSVSPSRASTPAASPAGDPIAPVSEVNTTGALPDWFLNDRFIGPWELAFILPPTETQTEWKLAAHEAIDTVFAEWQQVRATRETWLDGVDHWSERNRREVQSSRLVAHLLHYLSTAR